MDLFKGFKHSMDYIAEILPSEISLLLMENHYAKQNHSSFFSYSDKYFAKINTVRLELYPMEKNSLELEHARRAES